jgi:hypothetical protein
MMMSFRSRVVVCGVLLASLSGLAMGSTPTSWTGADSSSWSEATNWDNGVPESGYYAFLLSLTNNPVTLAESTTVDGLETGSGSALNILSGGVLTTGALSNSGTISLYDGTLALSGAGPFTNSGSILNTSGSVGTLSGNLTNTGTIAVSNDSTLRLAGGTTITNNGLFALDDQTAYGATNLVLHGTGAAETISLLGTGSLTMTSSANSNIIADADNLTLVNGADHTLSGSGWIGTTDASGHDFTFHNDGTVTANDEGAMLTFYADVVNAGLMQAVGGSGLAFINGSVTNTGGIIRADDSQVFLMAKPLTGGLLDAINGGNMVLYTGTTANDADLHVDSSSSASLVAMTYSGGTMDIAGTLSLTDSTISGTTIANSGTITNDSGSTSQFDGTLTNTGTIAVSDDSTLKLAGGSTITNNGLFTLNAGVEATTANLVLHGTGAAQTVSLLGSGSLIMGNSTNNRIDADAYNLTLVNGADHTISGSGRIGASGSGYPFTFRNDGTVTADGSAGLSFGAGANVVNAGLIQAVGGSTLRFLSSSVTNTGGIIRADGSLVLLRPSSFTGGLLDAINGGNMVFYYPSTAISDADLHVDSSSSASLAGTTYSAGTMDIAGMLSLADSIISGTTITNSGTITSISGSTNTLGGTLTNNGTLAVEALSQAVINGNFTNFASQTLTGGTYDVAGLLAFKDADIVTNAANVTLDGASAQITDLGSNNALSNLSTNSGSFSLLNGAGLSTSGSVTNTGAMTIGSGSTLTTTGYTQTGGSTVVNGTLDTAIFTLAGGTLGGSGTVLGDLVLSSDGSLSPGNSPGLFTVNGDYTQDSLATLEIELGGLLRGDEYDVLVVTGNMELAGTLDVTLYDGFTPSEGDSFDILDWGTLSGTFDFTYLPTLANGLYWDLSAMYTTGMLSVSGTLQPVPAPGAAALVLFGLATMARLRRRRS